MAKTTLSPEEIELTKSLLKDEQKSMGLRFRALFTLKNIGGKSIIDHIGLVLFEDKSALLKHECAYCLGQMKDEYSIDILSKVLSNKSENSMVRHEAAEALGAIASPECIKILEKFIYDSCEDVAETAQIAVDKIKYLRDPSNFVATNHSEIFTTRDPAVPLKKGQYKSIEDLKQILMDENQSLFTRYQAMFTLRNINTDESALVLASALDCRRSALFRHEVAFVLGQMQRPITANKLEKVLQNEYESEMVRHECAEALGAISGTKSSLQNYLNDKSQVVRESIIVALDNYDYNNSDQFQFLDKFH